MVHSAAEVLEAVALREVGKMALVDVSLVAVIVLSITMTMDICMQKEKTEDFHIEVML